jgi:transposase-like protein
MTGYLGYDKNDTFANTDGNARNAISKKKLKCVFGELPIDLSRERQVSFELQLISSHQTRWSFSDTKNCLVRTFSGKN